MPILIDDHRGSVVLYFHRLANAGGAERIICQLAGELAERGFSVHLISWDESDIQSFYPLHMSVQWTKLGYRQGFHDKLRRTNALTRLLKDNDVDVLIGFVMSRDKTVYAAAKLAGVRLVAAERNAPAMYWLRYNRFQRWISFFLLHLADRITVQMPEFVESYPISLRRRIETIPNPVPVALQKARPGIASDTGRFTLLVVSRLDGIQKQIDCLIKAFARVLVDYPTWDLRIIGDGPEQATLQRLASEHGAADQVQFEPAVADIYEAYVNAHLFAIPSLWEGFPNALAEALSHGLPAVGFEGAPGVADLIKKGGGWLAKGLDDEVTLADTLHQAMESGDERTRRGVLAVKSMAEFVPEKQFDRWATLLKSLIPDNVR